MESKRPHSSEEERSRKRLADEESDQEMSEKTAPFSSSSEKSSDSRSDSSTSGSKTSSSRKTPDPPSNSSSSSSNTNIEGLDNSDIDFLEKYDYKIIKKVGSGSFGYVYEAIDQTIHQTVAIKVLKEGHQYTTKSIMDRLIDTTNRLIELDHVNIMENYGHLPNFDQFNRLYIFSEFAVLPDLFNATLMINHLGNEIWWPLDEYQSRHLIKGIASGVAYMHSNGMSHSDLKLDNVLLFWSKNATTQQKTKSMADILTRDTYLIFEWIPKLTDFDKCMVKKDTDPEGKIMATLPRSQVNYGAPESYRGFEYDLIKADCYSVGCCLMAMLLASHPFDEPIGVVYPNSSDPDFDTKKLQHRNRSNQIKRDISYIKQLIKHLSIELRQVFLKLLDPNSETRISMNEFLADQWFTKSEQLYKHQPYIHGHTYSHDI